MRALYFTLKASDLYLVTNLLLLVETPAKLRDVKKKLHDKGKPSYSKLIVVVVL